MFIVPKNSGIRKIPRRMQHKSGAVESSILKRMQTQTPPITSVCELGATKQGAVEIMMEPWGDIWSREEQGVPDHGQEQPWEQVDTAEEIEVSEAGLLDGTYTCSQSLKCIYIPEPTEHMVDIVVYSQLVILPSVVFGIN